MEGMSYELRATSHEPRARTGFGSKLEARGSRLRDYLSSLFNAVRAAQ